jgi:hypothetical protein
MLYLTAASHRNSSENDLVLEFLGLAGNFPRCIAAEMPLSGRAFLFARKLDIKDTIVYSGITS